MGIKSEALKVALAELATLYLIGAVVSYFFGAVAWLFLLCSYLLILVVNFFAWRRACELGRRVDQWHWEHCINSEEPEKGIAFSDTLIEMLYRKSVTTSPVRGVMLWWYLRKLHRTTFND